MAVKVRAARQPFGSVTFKLLYVYIKFTDVPVNLPKQSLFLPLPRRVF